MSDSFTLVFALFFENKFAKSVLLTNRMEMCDHGDNWVTQIYVKEYNFTTDQELWKLLHMCGVYTQQVAALFCVKLRHGRHFECVTSN